MISRDGLVVANYRGLQGLGVVGHRIAELVDEAAPGGPWTPGSGGAGVPESGKRASEGDRK